MKIITIKLPKDAYISDIEHFKSNGIDINAIYHKTVTGCGITRFAIEYFKHNLIAILPNVPVIEAKVANHNEKFPKQTILGVHKGIDVSDIKAYLRSDVTYKKILTTPEGFMTKIIKAFGSDIYTMFNDYFLLFDECDRIITDVSYRGAIAAPLNLFHKFKKKAMVSATTLPFSDQKFKDFKHYVITPDYDYSKPLTLINTNNVVAAIEKQLTKLDTKQVCIFLNSTNGIFAIIKNLKIEKESIVFCAEESVNKLLIKGHKGAYSHFYKDKMKKYNFFTSRYFSAFDIELSSHPDVIMVSDVHFAQHSILDPHTEVIQIAGRLRNGVNSLTHITSFKPDLIAKTKKESLIFLAGYFEVYDGFVDQYKNATNPGSIDMLQRAIEESPAHSFYIEGELNHAMVDNFVYEQRVRGYYQHPKKLLAAYTERELHFTIDYKEDFYDISDEDLQNLNSKQSIKDQWREVAKILERLVAKPGAIVFGAIEMRNKLVVKYPLIVEAHRLLGLAGLEETEFVTSKINKAMDEAKKQLQIMRLTPFVHSLFNENATYSETEIIDNLKALYSRQGVKGRVYATYILKYFDGRRSSEKGKMVYNLKLKIDL